MTATIRWGVRGTSMPGFDATFDAAQLDQLRAVVDAFATTPPLPGFGPRLLGAPPAVDVARGAALWRTAGCATCHGEHGAGDGPAARTMPAPPYDLTREPIHRPHADGDERAAVTQAIALGVAGTAMPGYVGTVHDVELWALADYVISLAARANPPAIGELDATAIAADRATPLHSGRWPGEASDPDFAIFGAAIAPQGAPPPALAPAQASLHARQCGRCHAKQLREWQGSLHARAMSPGVVGQLDHELTPETVESCSRCHAPLAEQLMTPAPNPNFDPDLRAEGVTCASCHVRAWRRHGPPAVAPSLLPLPGYPLVTQTIYERGDLCLSCHQLPPRLAVAGKPLLNTYKEWLDGPYMRRGIQCQHCHMPNREHTFLGVHDPETVRQGIAVTADAHRSGDAVTVVATVRNAGAGHALPTTATPALIVTLELLDAHGTAIAGARAEQRIGRDVFHADDGWHERADTRIPPGGTTTIARAWRVGRTAGATSARVTIDVHPDAYYEGFYTDGIAASHDPAQRALYVDALRRARASRYTAETRIVPVR